MPDLQTTSHRAYLCPITGKDVPVGPHPADDLSLNGVSLHGADEGSIFAQLDRLGFELPDGDEAGGPWQHVGWTADGREAFALYERDSFVSKPPIAELVEGMAALSRARWPSARSGDLRTL